MDNNKQAPVFAKHSVLVNATPEKIWPLIVEVNHWSERFSHVKSAKMSGPFKAGTTFTWKSGGVTIYSTIHKNQPHSLIAWRGKAFGTRAEHEWKLTPQEHTTLLETSESFDGWLVRLMPASMQKMLDKTLIGWLSMIKYLAEK